jgi:hypothetical protein
MNYIETSNDKFAPNEKISNVILIFLLVARLTDNYLAVWIFGANTPEWYRHWYSGIAYILTVTIVWLNRHRLATLHIDRPFIIILITGGVLYSFFLRYDIGIFVGITAGLIFLAYKNNHLVLNNSVRYPKQIGLFIFLTILLALAPVLLFRPTLKSPLDLNTFTTSFSQVIIAELALIAFEEVLFRGALWAYVRSLGLSEQTTFYTTTILFWISHFRYLALPYVFWVSLPICSILLGLMTLRSKSLTPSTIGHFIFNFISQLLVIIYI